MSSSVGVLIYKENEHLLRNPLCLGPRGVHMGGLVDPSSEAPLGFTKADFKGRVWHIGCHDEACVHALKGERCNSCWLIPGVDMGDVPPKTDGEFEHLAECDSEMWGGTISLDGTIGQISRKELRSYIEAKRGGISALVPRYCSICFHAGASGEGYWTGDDALTMACNSSSSSTSFKLMSR